MTRKTEIKRPIISVPQNLDEAAKFLSFIGQEQRKIESIQTALNEEIEELKNKTITKSKPYQEKISQLVEGLFAFAQSHRDELTDKDKRKTVDLTVGWFGWRMTPPAVSIRNIKSVLKRIKELGLKQFIRIKEEPNKEAMLREPEKAKMVKGISIKQHEEFVVKPTELKVEITKKIPL